MKNLALVLSFLGCITSFSQNIYTDFNDYEQYLIDKSDLSADENIHTTCKPFSSRYFIADTLADSNLTKRYSLYFDSNETRKERVFFANRKDLYSVNTKDFRLAINPVINFSLGKDFSGNETLFQNTRGIKLSGTIDKKLSFYTTLTDNQISLPEYVDQNIKLNTAVPYQGLWKRFKKTGYDYFNAQGYVNYQAIKHVDITLGTGNLFIGDGHRSLFLSQFSGNVPYLRLNTKVWKINYTNIYAKLTSDFPTSGGIPIDGLYPSKYLTAHHLSINIKPNFNIGLYEAIIFERKDSNRINYGYDLAYLNPLIFYRAVEQNLGSPDNALIGLNAKWNIKHKLQLYGQLVLDEFKLSEIKAQNGWWANKFGIQSGFKYIDAFGINNLHLQGEINIVRPYTYSHGKSLASYTHFKKPLAHPLGANLTELIGIVKYRASKKLFLQGKAFLIETGKDDATSNWGSNPFLGNNTKEQEFGNKIGQGINTKIAILNLSASYEVYHNIFIDAQQFFRKETNQLSTNYTSLGLRANIGRTHHDF